MQKRRPEPKLRQLNRPPTLFPMPDWSGILGQEFFIELIHQLQIRNEREPERRIGDLWKLNAKPEERFLAHVNAVLKMYGAPEPFSIIPGSDDYDPAPWRRVVRDMLADILDLDRFGDLKGLVESFSKLVFGNMPDRFEYAAFYLAHVQVNTQHPGLAKAKNTGRPRRWSPLRL